MDLLSDVYANQEDLPEKIREYIRSGENLSAMTEYGESALTVSSNNGRFDVVKLLLDGGAAPAQLGWTPTFYEVAYGDLESVKRSVAEQNDLEARDYWSRTPWLLSIQVGEIDKAALLLEIGADQNAVGRCEKVPMAYAIQSDDVKMLQWLIDQGFDIEFTDEFLETPLITACELGAFDCARLLIASGADIYKCDHLGQSPIYVASSMAIVKLLVDSGADINNVSEESHAMMHGLDVDGSPTVTPEQYLKDRYRTFGSANPEKVDKPFWLDMIKTGASSWQAQRTYSDRDSSASDRLWTYKRFGRTINILDDGRTIEIGGEHEDFYDPDFCIYNDVTVFHADEEIEIYTYPEDLFPPTDFHTSTRVNGYIYIIGGLGYSESRIPGFTAVYRLDINSYAIERVETGGENPGWIYGHRASAPDPSTISIQGGTIINHAGEYIRHDRRYQLNLLTGQWTLLES